MIRFLAVIAAVTLLLAAPSVDACEGGAYVEGQVGMFLPIRSYVKGGFAEESSRLTFEPGIVVAALGGYEFPNGLRGEGEFNFRRLYLDKLSSDSGRVDAHGDVFTYGFMANLYYDFRNRTVVTPYVGAGIGFAVARFGKGTANDTELWSGDEDVSVAYQGIGGFTLRVTDRTSLDFAYHHYAVPRLHFETLSAQFRGPNLSLGLRHSF